MPALQEPLISIRDLSIHYQGMSALENVDLDISAGKIVTIVGPNGAGKSSLVRAIIGVVPPSSGRIARIAGLRIGYVPQKLEAEALMPLQVGRFLDLPHRASHALRQAVITQTGIAALTARPLAALSGGEMRRVLLAHALLAKPNLLILDEPTAGLDQPALVAFYELIEALRHDQNMAILLVSHDLNVVLRSSDHVICLNGHICCQGAPVDVSGSAEYQSLFGTAPVAFYEHHHDHQHDPV